MMDDQPLLLTKISIPQNPAQLVHRPRLTGKIQQDIQGPLTLLATPAGFGKTQLLVEWANETELPVAWLTLEPEDNDVSRFFRYLVGALQTIEAGLGEEALNYSQVSKVGGLEAGLVLLINEISALRNDLALVLDDFQAIENVEILRGLGFLLKYLPSNLHLLIASRSVPELDLASLYAKGRVLDLTADDLRFTGEEVQQYFMQTSGLQLPPETVQALEERSEGWITSLQMVAISLQNQADPIKLLSTWQVKTHYLEDFMAEEVLGRQPEEVRQFLLKSSVLDSLTGSLCQAAVNPEAEPGYGSSLLNDLERSNLFITAIDGEHEWFRYHPLFADYLRHAYAQTQPNEIPLLKKRAARWFEQNGNLEKAFQYALESQDIEWAADLLEHNTETLIQTGAIFPLTDSISRLPDAVIQDRPALGLAYAWGLIASNRMEPARFWLDDVRRWIGKVENQPNGSTKVATGYEAEQVDLWKFQGWLAMCESALAVLSGNLEQAAEYSRMAASYLQDENPFIQSLIAFDNSISSLLSGDTQKATEALRETIRTARRANNLIVLIIATCEMAYVQAYQGRLSQAWATLQKAENIAAGPNGKPLPLAGLVDIGFGNILLERGELAEAQVYLERGCQLIQNSWVLGSLDGMMSLSRLRQAQGDHEGAQVLLSEAFQISCSNESSQWDSQVLSAVAVRIALRDDNPAEAEQWWVRGGFPNLAERIPVERYPYHIFEYLQLTQARFLLRKGQDTGNKTTLRLVEDLLQMLLPEAQRLQRVASQIEILTLLAQVQAALQDNRAAYTLLQALALGEPEGYWQIFLDEGWHLSTLLEKCQGLQEGMDRYLPSPDFLRRLADMLPQPVDGLLLARQPGEQRFGQAMAHFDDGLPVCLSAREIEVLNLIAEGKSNQEISEQLYLSLYTVKRHAYNIFAKLEVNKRTQAVMKARHLALIA